MAGMDSLPFDRPCSVCHAKPTELCKNSAGLVIRGVHPERWQRESPSAQTLDGDIVRPATVFVVVNPDYGTRLAQLPRDEPVWILDTPVNRIAAEELWVSTQAEVRSRDVTLFKSTAPSAEDHVINHLDTIDLHHGVYSANPPYSAFEIIGAELTDRLRTELALFGLTEITINERGFRSGRQV